MHNIILSATPNSDIYSDTASIYSFSSKTPILTQSSLITALTGTSTDFIFSTQDKQIHHHINNTLTSIQLPKQVSTFNTSTSLPFALRNGDIITFDSQTPIFSRSVTITTSIDTKFGDRDGIYFEFESGRINKMKNLENAILSISGRVIVTNRKVFIDLVEIYSSERLDGGISFNEKIYIIQGTKIICLTENGELQQEFQINCLERVSGSVPQLQLLCKNDQILIFSNNSKVYGLDGEVILDVVCKEVSVAEAKGIWPVTELWGN